MTDASRTETWLITGASRGIGIGVVRAHLRRGGHVLAGIRAAGPDLAGLQADHPDRLTLLNFDLRDAEEIRRAADSVTGPIDVLFNNAAVFGPRQPSFRNADCDGILDAVDVNALGTLRVIDAFLPHMANAVRPRIVAVSSLMGAMSKPGVGQLAYRASKATLNKIMQSVAQELQPQKIAVACLRPGFVRTEMTLGQGQMSSDENAVYFLSIVDTLQFGSPLLRFIDISGDDLDW